MFIIYCCTGSNITIGLTVTDIDENDNVETIILRSNTDVVLKKRDFTSHNKKSPRIMSADFEVPMEVSISIVEIF